MGRTGHAEVIQITFNPEIITYETLLDIFSTFTIRHKSIARAPTPTQYRSIILHTIPEQRVAAEKMIATLNNSETFRVEHQVNQSPHSSSARHLLYRRSLPPKVLRPEPRPTLLLPHHPTKNRKISGKI